jgi:hypothetical protein
VLVPTTLGRSSLRACLEGVLRQTVRPRQLVVVCPAGADAHVPDLPEGVRLVTAPASSNGQRNAGARAVDTDLVLFVDDDNVLADDFAERLLWAWRDIPGPVAGMAGVITNDPRHSGWRNAVYFLLGLGCTAYRARTSRLRSSGHVLSVYQPSGVVPAGFLHGCCVAYDRKIFLRELFDETFTGHVSGGDLDAAARIRRHGYLFQVPDAHSYALPVESTMPADGFEQGLRFGETLAYYRWRHRARGGFGVVAWEYANVGQVVLLIARMVATGSGRPFLGYLAGLVRAHRRIMREAWRPR